MTSFVENNSGKGEVKVGQGPQRCPQRHGNSSQSTLERKGVRLPVNIDVMTDSICITDSCVDYSFALWGHNWWYLQVNGKKFRTDLSLLPHQELVR